MLWLWFISSLVISFSPDPGSYPSLPRNFKLLFNGVLIPVSSKKCRFTDLVFRSGFPKVQVVRPRETLHAGGQREGGVHVDDVLLDVHV